MRLIGAIALVLLTYNPTGYFFYHWALRDFAAITALKAFAVAAGRMDRPYPHGICIPGRSGAAIECARARYSGLDA
jgi:hypothetical protein